MLPFHSLVAEHRELGLVLAVAIGFGFGFVLERAGFGRADKLAAQFYLHDMTVFKVMFGAIVTAMLGLMVASGVGLIDLRSLSESAASYTYIWPMLVGGLLLGAGFIVSGYCPGTSVVATASGNLDGLFTFVGVIVGSLVYGEIEPLVQAFHVSGEKGHLFLYDVLGVPAPALAAGVAVMAVLMFVGAEKVERRFTRKRLGGVEPDPPARRPRRYAFAAIGALVALALGAMAVPVGSEAAPSHSPKTVDVGALARRVLDEPWSIRILDLRARESCAKSRVPTSECVPLAEIDELGLAYTAGARDLVLVYSVGPHEGRLPAAALAYPGQLYVLEGGFAAWRDYALTRPPVPGPAAAEAEREEYRFRAALVGAMTGRKPPPPPPPTGAAPPPKKKKGGGCG